MEENILNINLENLLIIIILLLFGFILFLLKNVIPEISFSLEGSFIISEG
jgi:hypothetical protein